MSRSMTEILFGTQCTLHPMLGCPSNRVFYHHGNNEQSVENERIIEITQDSVCPSPI